MDQNNEIKLNDKEMEMFADIKQEIIDDVKAEVTKLGYDIIPQGYEGTKDIVSIVDKAHKLRLTHDEEVERIKQRYSNEVANSKLKVLEQDYKMDMEALADDIDQVLVKDAKYRQEAILELQSKSEYKESFMNTLNILSVLKGIDVPHETLANIIQPIAEAKDKKGLELVKLLVGNSATNVYMIDRMIEGIDSYIANNELKNFSDSAKKFISTGQDDFSLFAYMKHYGGE